MPFLVLLGLVWFVGVPLITLFLAVGATRRARRLEGDLQQVQLDLARLEAVWRRTGAPDRAAAPVPESAAAGAGLEPGSVPEVAALSLPAVSVTADPTVPPALTPAGAASAVSGDPGITDLSDVPPLPPWPGAGAEPTEPQPVAESGPARMPINWEQFMGVKLFAWVGGFALFLAVAFFVKYSFENNLISPQLRVALGFLAGLGLLVGGVLLQRKAYAATAQTLCGTGVVILYAVTFASHGYYGFIGKPEAFALMVLVTASAFIVAIRQEAMVVAILGLVGGFLTPPLLSTGVDRPLGLFGYVAILDAGLIAVALKRRWHFLTLLAVAGTVLTQIGWAGKFFAVEKASIALTVFAGFNLLFLAGCILGQRPGELNRWLVGSALVPPLVTFGFTLWLLSYAELAQRPGLLYAFLLAADLPVLALVLRRAQLHPAYLLAGGAVFLILAIWTVGRLSPELLYWALGGYLGFAGLHTAFPLVLQRLRPGISPVWWGHVFPPLALALVLAPLLREFTVDWRLWPVVLLLNAVAVALALVTGAVGGIVVVLLLTLAVMGVWMTHGPADLGQLPGYLAVIGGFAVFFGVAGVVGGRRILERYHARRAEGGESTALGMPEVLGPWLTREGTLAEVPALAAILPFLLLIMVVERLPLANPSPVYGLAMLLVVVLLGLGRYLKLVSLAPVALACALALQYSWHAARFSATTPTVPLLWNLAFTAVFVVYPFVFRREFAAMALPWVAAALSGPLHFYLVHQVVKLGFPNRAMGLLPAAFALPMLGALAWVIRSFAPEAPRRSTVLAWFGGSALFFVTLIFPIQFDKQWITLGWALEGAALLWLFRRVPHRGLPWVGTGLLAVAFVRLALNPAVLEYHARTDVRIFNWMLYTYGMVTVCLFVGARLLAPGRLRLGPLNAPAFLGTLGTVLAFLLINLQIADYFAEGSTLTFQFSGNFARDMTYSIAWALFALGLLVVGVWKRQPAVRYASLALLGVTLLKLFFHDLVRLSALYRIGAFLGVAVISILASVLYQRFFAAAAREATGNLSASGESKPSAS